MLDTARPIETPEGIAVELRLAGPVVRFVAYFVDTVIRLGVYLILSTVLVDLLGRLGDGLLLVAIFLLEWLYPVPFEVMARGATPGKRIMGIRVVQQDGLPVSWAASMIRNLIRAVDFLPFAYAFGVIAMLIDRDFRRLGDLAAGTVVAYADTAPAPPAAATANPRPLPGPLALDEQRALVGFAERDAGLTRERTAELAGLLEPLTGCSGEAGVQRVREFAAWLGGRE